MNIQKNITGYLLIFAATTFWLSWFLMPDAGTTDTNHILQIVKESRGNVLCSVIIQIISCVVYVFALFRLAQHSFPQKKTTLIGITLLAIGVMGLCADAFFHLLAFFMTDGAVSIEENVVRVMQFMQTTGVIFLMPLLLPFFVGNVILGIGLKKQVIVSKFPAILFISAFAFAIVGDIITHTILQYNGPAVSLMTLGIFAAGQVIIGAELTTPR